MIFEINTAGTIFTHTNPQTTNPSGDSKCHEKTSEGFDAIAIYFPPGFKIAAGESGKVGLHDSYCPGWTVVCVPAVYRDSGLGWAGNSSTLDKERYYVPIEGVTVPSVAGKYFFKIALLNSEELSRTDCEEAGSIYVDADELALRFIPIENCPVMLVKGEFTPAMISGTIRYGDYNGALYNQPIQEPGRVYAKMITRLDPYTGAARPDLPLVDAVSYFNATAQGHYEVEGLAPGVYDLYASAAGYPQALIQFKFTVPKGQSLHFDGYLQPGAVIHGSVFTKHKLSGHPWPETAYVKIELYDGPTLDHTPDPRANKVAWTPLPHVTSGQQNIPTRTRDPQDVGPPQDWHVEGGTTCPFPFEFGVKGEYGAPRDFDGMVPQVYATWVNGLTPGRYYARAWIPRYDQSAVDGSTFLEYFFDVTPNEWAEDITLAINLRLSSRVNNAG